MYYFFTWEVFSFCHVFYGYEGYYFKVMKVISYLNDYLK